MEILYLLVPLGLGVAIIIGAIFWWALHSGQFDELDAPGVAVLLEESNAQPARSLEFSQVAPRPARENSPNEQ
jgi:cbb3-type cytochrome oxidase maturation protein